MPFTGRAKRSLRHVVDRLAMPYVEAAVERLRAPADPYAGGGIPRVFVELPLTLHAARTLALADMPAGAKTLLSIGAGDRWYLNWIEETYGHVARHVAVERFLPVPDDLPDSVEWLSLDVADLPFCETVESGTVDLVYSGQNIEHLWPEQLLSFLAVSHDLLADNGWLVIDSPNRNLTRAYNWSMAEHTVEFTPDEATRMLQLAGFEVVTMKGVWLGREAGRLLPLDPARDPGGPESVLRRMVLASNRPADSFIWWAEARKHGSADVAALRRYVEEVFRASWPERLNRLLPGPGAIVDHVPGDPEGEVMVLPAGTAGEVATGPRMALPAGTYTFRVTLKVGAGGESGPVGTYSVCAGSEVLASCAIPLGVPDRWIPVDLDVVLPDTRFDVGIQVTSNGGTRLAVLRSLLVEPEPWVTSPPE